MPRDDFGRINWWGGLVGGIANEIGQNPPPQNQVAQDLDFAAYARMARMLRQEREAAAARAQAIFLAGLQVPVQAPEPDEEGDMINNFQVGCDPEFMLVAKETGGTIMANQYFGYDGEIGYDHGGRVAEFRPSPSKGVLTLVRKIHRLVNGPTMALTATRKLRAGALCNGDCLGGHVHFGFDCFRVKPPANTSVLHGGEFNERGGQVTKALDALTKALEHLDILPKTESAQRRASAQGVGGSYGAYGDVRDCHGHMEYRTMASWLFDPKVAFLCLTAAKCAAADPVEAYAQLRLVDSFPKFRRWLEIYANKDLNAARVSEKLLAKGLPFLQVDPTVDFRARWAELEL